MCVSFHTGGEIYIYIKKTIYLYIYIYVFKMNLPLRALGKGYSLTVAMVWGHKGRVLGGLKVLGEIKQK